MRDTDRLSLYKLNAESAYESSIIATYAINFPFYERVVLRRLQAAGCRHNILLVDGGQCARQLESVEMRPHFCGSDYLLLPIKSAASFHPKFLLLVGRRGARLIVGSHNITLAGFGLNREIATAFACEREGPTAVAAQHVWRFVRSWTTGFPQKIREVIAATERVAPWLLTQGEAPSSPTIWGSQPLGTTLWNQVKEQLGQRAKRVTIVSPYFDTKLAFIKVLEKELHPKECVVAVHPKFSELPANAPAISPRTRWVDISGLGEDWAKRFLHAKLFRFDLMNGDVVVVLGSANASEPAWLANGDDRNAELVVVHRDAKQLWNRLELSGIATAPELAKNDWAEIKTRMELKKKEPSLPAPFLAVVTSSGFLVDQAFVKGIEAGLISVVVNEVATAAIQSIRSEHNAALCVCESEAIRVGATRLEVTPASGRKRIALVHQVSELLDKAAGKMRQAFRRALSGLEGDPDQLAELLAVVEKVIFDDQIPLDVDEGTAHRKPAKDSKSGNAAEPETLGISTKNTSRARHRPRLSASSDLAVIIDALIYRLGQGLPTKQEEDSPNSAKPSEEEFRDEESAPPEIDGHMLAKACRGKVNRLFRRMIAQCEAAVERGKDATTPVVQLAAVLGIVKHLKTRQPTFAWLPHGEQLVDSDHAWDFFKDASRHLYGPSYGLAAKALAEHDTHEFDELTAVRGLLTWLGLDSDLDIRVVLDDVYNDPDAVREDLIGVAYLLPVITECVQDEPAEAVLSAVSEEVRQSLKESISYHMEWARRIEDAFHDRRRSTAPIALGDIVWPLKMADLGPMVVLDPRSSSTGVVNLDTGKPKLFGTDFVARIQSLMS